MQFQISTLLDGSDKGYKKFDIKLHFGVYRVKGEPNLVGYVDTSLAELSHTLGGVQL